MARGYLDKSHPPSTRSKCACVGVFSSAEFFVSGLYVMREIQAETAVDSDELRSLGMGT